ncbi:MAG: hypothetical protein C0392_01630 [Syntrophus sp. (in: bacteria)]|nr:hypothetical protein [Syntrophus sp. (in: bacteria)]
MTQYLELLTARVSEGKQILVYGAGSQGRGVVRALREHGIEPAGFIDRNPDLHGRFLAGLPVFAPEVLSEPGAVDSTFVIIAVFFFEHEVSGFLESCGFIRNVSYVAYSSLKPRDYVVEVSGICNLHCISCPRGGYRTNKRSTRMMSLDTFKKVITKIRREDPFVGNIQLYQWGEPTLNKYLPDIVRYARANSILCTISSNLNYAADFRALIESRPECLRISVSGTGESYGITHTGGNWNAFVSNVETIAGLRQEIYPEMKVELYYHRYKHSIGIQQEQVAEMCSRFDFEFHPVPAYLISLDDVLGYCEGTPLPDAAHRARKLLLIDIDEGLAMAKAEASLDCDSLRVVMINADLSVSTCMMYYDPERNTCAGNFLETSIENITTQRMTSSLCVRCRNHGIHRYCGIYAKISEEERY